MSKITTVLVNDIFLLVHPHAKLLLQPIRMRVTLKQIWFSTLYVYVCTPLSNRSIRKNFHLKFGHYLKINGKIREYDNVFNYLPSCLMW